MKTRDTERDKGTVDQEKAYQFRGVEVRCATVARPEERSMAHFWEWMKRAD